MQIFKILFISMMLFSSANCHYNQIYEGRLKAEYGEYLSIVQSLLPDNPVVIEAGGHYGIDTNTFAETWPNGTIFSFEPNPNAFSKLVLATYRHKHVKALPIALADFDGEAVLHVCYGTTGDNPLFEGASSLLEASDYMAIHYQGPKVVVPCKVLDHWCTENNVSHVDFMWLDMEGMELQTLRSSPQILKTVKAIIIETNFQEFRKGMTQFKQLEAFLKASGFTLLCHSYAEGFQGNALFVR